MTDRCPRGRTRAAARAWLAACVTWLGLARADERDVARALARVLAEEGDWAGAAIEYRRLALGESDADARAGWRWMAAYSHWRDGRHDLAESMLDRAESESPRLLEPSLWMRAEIARSRGREREAIFYYEAFARHAVEPEPQALGRRAALAERVRTGDRAGARESFAAWPDAPPDVAAAMRRYQSLPEKRPWLGGVLGLVPGLGYLYSGQPGSAARSLLLNALFLYGMYETAREELWGGFLVLGLFELTWYSGSVYGGLAAAHEYNRRQAESVAADLRGGMRWAPDEIALPLVRLRFEF